MGIFTVMGQQPWQPWVQGLSGEVRELATYWHKRWGERTWCYIHTLTWILAPKMRLPVRQKGESSTDRGLGLKVGIWWGSSSIAHPSCGTHDGFCVPEYPLLHWGGEHVISFSTLSFLLIVCLSDNVTWVQLSLLRWWIHLWDKSPSDRGEERWTGAVEFSNI